MSLLREVEQGDRRTVLNEAFTMQFCWLRTSNTVRSGRKGPNISYLFASEDVQRSDDRS